MRRSSKRPTKSSSADNAKAPVTTMTEDRKRDVTAQFTDDVLSKLTGAFFDVCKIERWTKRDLSAISGINETAISHILAGRRKNLTVETIALLTRAMRKRPELLLHDLRATGNSAGMIEGQAQNSAANALQEKQVQQPRSHAAN